MSSLSAVGGNANDPEADDGDIACGYPTAQMFWQ